MYSTIILLYTCLLGTSFATGGPWYCWVKSPPSSIQKGHPTKLQWQGGDGSPITIVLGQVSESYHYVSTIASNLTEPKSFDWTPSRSLAAGPGYVVRLTQGVENCDSAYFTITGHSNAASLSKPSPTTTTLGEPSPVTTTSAINTSTALGITSSASSTTSANISPTPKPASSGLSDSAKGGIAGGIIAVLVICLAIFIFGRYRRQLQRRKQQGIAEQAWYSQQAKSGVASNDAEAVVKEKRGSSDSRPELHGEHVPPYSRELEGSPGLPEGEGRFELPG
ncbi:tripeptidyl-peptidase SED1 [Physcia stellaris]|nr:tripeptidyl-peptidase SED1 [Physcia stellaris]